jgi:hypothetical protein
VVDIPGSQLQKAETHLRSVVEAEILRERDVDWRVVKTQLERLQTALADGNRSEFAEAFAMLKSRLNPANVLRGEIGSEPKSKVPVEIFELLNHIVGSLHLELKQPPSSPPKDEPKSKPEQQK